MPRLHPLSEIRLQDCAIEYQPAKPDIKNNNTIHDQLTIKGDGGQGSLKVLLWKFHGVKIQGTMSLIKDSGRYKNSRDTGH